MTQPDAMRAVSWRFPVAGERVLPKSRLWAVAPLVFVVAHAPLALALKLIPYFSTLHALVSLALVLTLVIRRYPIGWVVAGCAYLVGSETLWRMTHARLFWEFGKYALLFIVIMALYLRRQRITSYIPAFYFVLLLPGALITMTQLSDISDLRQALSFNLSGPLLYAACCLFLFGRRMSREDVLLGLTAMVAPIVAVVSLTFLGIETSTVTFGASSLKSTSGGFGPNQVSAALGLGMVLCLLLLTGKKSNRMWRGVLVGLLVWFGIHSALTFSRSGLYYAAAAMLAGSIFLVSDMRRFISLLVLALPLLGAVKFLILPKLDDYTGGALLARFENKSLTGRGTLMAIDLNLFLEHPFLGVGVGMGDESRSELRGGALVHSHTEFTRLISEHGLLGLAALTLLLMISLKSVTLQTPGWPRAFSASLMVFAFMFMTGSGMRMAAPSFLLAFAGVKVALPPAGRTQAQRLAPVPGRGPISRLPAGAVPWPRWQGKHSPPTAIRIEK